MDAAPIEGSLPMTLKRKVKVEAEAA